MLLNKSKSYDVVLFDLDGTLLDTSEGILESVRYVLDIYHLPILTDEQLKLFVGPPIQKSLQKWCGLDEHKAQEVTNTFREYYKEKALMKAIVYDGILPLIIRLKENGIKVGVATYKREDYALMLLEHYNILRYCDVAHGADNFNQLSKSDILSICINELNVEKDSVVLIGDTDNDVIGANQVGIDFIGVTWGFGFKERTNELSPSFVGLVDTVDELSSLILKTIN